MIRNPRRPYFDSMAARWDFLPAAPDAAARIRGFVARAIPGGAKRILDVGCGTGVLVPDIVDLCSGLRCLVELDLAVEMLAINAAKFPLADIGRICADAQALPFKDSCFDLVFCFGVLPHFDDTPSALENIFRILTPGGALCIGHLMGSRELNSFHSHLDGPVSKDEIPAVETLARIVRQMGGKEIVAEERPDWYFLRAEKGR